MHEDAKRRIVDAIDKLTKSGREATTLRLNPITAAKHGIHCTTVSFYDAAVVGEKHVRPVELTVTYDSSVREDALVVGGVERAHHEEVA